MKTTSPRGKDGSPHAPRGRWGALRPFVPEFVDAFYSSEGLRGTLLAIIVGVVAGFGAVGFRLLISAFRTVFFSYLAEALAFLGEWKVVTIPALGGALVGPMVYFLAREAKGHGVPEVMDAVANQGGRIRARVSVVKALASSLCIGSGGSVGREGPIVQIGASFGSVLGQRLGLSADWTRTLVACGAAGGISATFNAPLAGVFFALEVILGRFTARYFSFVVVSSVVAAAVGHGFIGDVASFTVPEYKLVSAVEFPFYAVLGLFSGLMGFLLARILYLTEDGFDAIPFPEYTKPIIGGLGVGLVGFYAPEVFGVGYETIEKALTSRLTLGFAATLLGLKLVATSLTLGSGGSGGIFAPSLFLGAMLGEALGSLIHAIFPAITAEAGAYSLVGMAGVFAGAAHAPMTSILIVFEMTRDYRLMLPVMTTVVLATLVSQRLGTESIYTLKLVRRGSHVRPPEHINVLDAVSVGSVMTRDFQTVRGDATLREIAPLFEKEGYRGFPVVDAKGNLEGIITLSDVESAMEQEQSASTLVGDVATRAVVTAYPDQSVHEALLRLGARDVGRIPVVSRQDPKRVVGILRRHDLVRAYTNIFDGSAGGKAHR